MGPIYADLIPMQRAILWRATDGGTGAEDDIRAHTLKRNWTFAVLYSLPDGVSRELSATSCLMHRAIFRHYALRRAIVPERFSSSHPQAEAGHTPTLHLHGGGDVSTRSATS